MYVNIKPEKAETEKRRGRRRRFFSAGTVWTIFGKSLNNVLLKNVSLNRTNKRQTFFGLHT